MGILDDMGVSKLSAKVKKKKKLTTPLTPEVTVAQDKN